VDVESPTRRLNGKRKELISRELAKPSDGLEPSTPSLPSWARRGKRGHGRVTKATKAPQTKRIRHGDVTRAWTRVNRLMFAPRSHALPS
jgi:hypothetical protein